MIAIHLILIKFYLCFQLSKTFFIFTQKIKILVAISYEDYYVIDQQMDPRSDVIN